MPGLGSMAGVLDDEKIAAIVTYIRRSWGNDASAVTPQNVRCALPGLGGTHSAVDWVRAAAAGPAALNVGQQ